nr:hypothetical protein Iba_chr06cCG10310 [Ipomoea batatas]
MRWLVRQSRVGQGTNWGWLPSLLPAEAQFWQPHIDPPIHKAISLNYISLHYLLEGCVAGTGCQRPEGCVAGSLRVGCVAGPISSLLRQLRLPARVLGECSLSAVAGEKRRRVNE